MGRITKNKCDYFLEVSDRMITKDMTIAEVIRMNPDTVPVFLRYGMHCLGCPTATGESLAEAAMAHGIDLEKMLRDLNEVVKEQ